MSQNLQINNFNSLNRLAETNLTADYAAGVSILGVSNSYDFQTGSLVLIGQPGDNRSELLTAAIPPNSSSINLTSPTLLPHNNSDQVTSLFGNQVQIYKALDTYGSGQQPADSSFTLLATTSIDTSSQTTNYTDQVGVAGTWYKYTYYNSVTQQATSLSDSSAVQAGKAHYVSLDDIRRAAGFQDSQNLSDQIIAQKRDAAEREINGALLAVYTFPLPQPTNPIIEQIALNIAAGELMHQEYMTISPSMAAEGENKAASARHGGGAHTSLDELVLREVVLTDANFNEQTIEEGHGFGGWPDGTTQYIPTYGEEGYDGFDRGGDQGHQFTTNEVY